MKKLMLLAGLYFFLQPNLHAASGSSNVKFGIAPTSASARAMAHFKENFAWVQEVTWFNEPDNMYCVFHQGNMVNRVFYDEHGYWQYTLISYPPSSLTKTIKEKILNNFGGYKITYVNEIRSENYEPVYMISMENEDNIKIIRISGDDMQVKQDLKKG
jgi:hypothetical protein